MGKYLNELCDCDVYTRWVCHKCVVDEIRFTSDYYDDNTISEDDDRLSEERIESWRTWSQLIQDSKTMVDHGFEITVCNLLPRSACF